MSTQPSPPSTSSDLTLSELIPLRSKKIDFLRSKALIPLLVITVTCLVLYAVKITTIDDALNYMYWVTTFLLIITFLPVYYYGGEQKNILWYVWPAAVTYVQFKNLFPAYDAFFQHMLPGAVFEEQLDGFLQNFRAYFFGVGLREDTMKAVPGFIALLVAYLVRTNRVPNTALSRGFSLQGPLDGMLIGIASGQVFTLIETMGQYVPNTIFEVARDNGDNVGLGLFMGIKLMIPRVLDGVMGHAAYGAIVGYFTGLAVSHPKATWKLLPLGLIVSAVCHTLWDTLGQLVPGPYYEWIAGGLTVIVFFGCLLKAKQLEASRIGGAIDGRSILALSPPPAEMAFAAPAGIVPPRPPGLAGLFTPIASGLEKIVAFTAKTTVPTAGTAVASPLPLPPVAAQRVAIASPTARFALAPNAALDFSALFGANGVPPGFKGLVAAAPDGGFEIVNTGAVAFAATMPDGSASSVVPGGRVRAAAGTRLALGPATLSLDIY